MTESYSRIYHRFASEFPTVYADDRAMATWVRLLLLADASWPMRPPLPRSVKARTLGLLVSAGLVDFDGDTYSVKGLDAERSRRRDAARTGAAKRWHSDGNANASADAMPRRERDEKSKAEKETPPPPAKRGRRENETNPRSTGSAPRSTGSNPRAIGTSPRAVRRDEKRGPTMLHQVLTRAAAVGDEP